MFHANTPNNLARTVDVIVVVEKQIVCDWQGICDVVDVIPVRREAVTWFITLLKGIG